MIVLEKVLDIKGCLLSLMVMIIIVKVIMMIVIYASNNNDGNGNSNSYIKTNIDNVSDNEINGK